MCQRTRQRLKQSSLAVITLGTPEARIGTWLSLTVIIYAVPFSWLENLSLYKLLGWESAPSIGLTRAYWLTLHGQFSEAWVMNPLIAVVLVIGIPLLATDIMAIIRNHQSGQQ